jgi:hypothetical protein
MGIFIAIRVGNKTVGDIDLPTSTGETLLGLFPDDYWETAHPKEFDFEGCQKKYDAILATLPEDYVAAFANFYETGLRYQRDGKKPKLTISM